MTILEFLQKNAEWLCAIAIVIFTAFQCWISHSQYRQELRLKRFELAHQMDEACIIYSFDKKSIRNVIDWFNKNQSNFMYLLNEKDLIKYDSFQEYLKELFYKNPNFNNGIKVYRKHLVELDVALLNASYGIRKLKKQKKTRSFS